MPKKEKVKLRAIKNKPGKVQNLKTVEKRQIDEAKVREFFRLIYENNFDTNNPYVIEAIKLFALETGLRRKKKQKEKDDEDSSELYREEEAIEKFDELANSEKAKYMIRAEMNKSRNEIFKNFLDKIDDLNDRLFINFLSRYLNQPKGYWEFYQEWFNSPEIMKKFEKIYNKTTPTGEYKNEAAIIREEIANDLVEKAKNYATEHDKKSNSNIYYEILRDILGKENSASEFEEYQKARKKLKKIVEKPEEDYKEKYEKYAKKIEELEKKIIDHEKSFSEKIAKLHRKIAKPYFAVQKLLNIEDKNATFAQLQNNIAQKLVDNKNYRKNEDKTEGLNVEKYVKKYKIPDVSEDVQRRLIRYFYKSKEDKEDKKSEKKPLETKHLVNTQFKPTITQEKQLRKKIRKEIEEGIRKGTMPIASSDVDKEIEKILKQELKRYTELFSVVEREKAYAFKLLVKEAEMMGISLDEFEKKFNQLEQYAGYQEYQEGQEIETGGISQEFIKSKKCIDRFKSFEWIKTARITRTMIAYVKDAKLTEKVWRKLYTKDTKDKKGKTIDGEKYYEPNSRYYLLQCIGKKSQKGNILTIVTPNERRKFKVIFMKNIVENGKTSEKLAFIQDEKIFSLQEEYEKQQKLSKRENLRRMLDEPLNSSAIIIAKSILSEAFLRISQRVDYGRDGDINTDFLNAAIEGYQKFNKNATNGDLLYRVAEVLTFLKIPQAEVFHQRIADEYYKGDLILSLSHEEMFPELYMIYMKSYIDQEKLSEWVLNAIRRQFDIVKEKFYMLSDPSAKASILSLIDEYNYNMYSTFREFCENKDDVLSVPVEYLIHYTDGDKIYCFDERKLAEEFNNKNYINPYTGKKFSKDFIDTAVVEYIENGIKYYFGAKGLKKMTKNPFTGKDLAKGFLENIKKNNFKVYFKKNFEKCENPRDVSGVKPYNIVFYETPEGKVYCYSIEKMREMINENQTEFYTKKLISKKYRDRFEKLFGLEYRKVAEEKEEEKKEEAPKFIGQVDPAIPELVAELKKYIENLEAKTFSKTSSKSSNSSKSSKTSSKTSSKSEEQHEENEENEERKKKKSTGNMGEKGEKGKKEKSKKEKFSMNTPDDSQDSAEKPLENHKENHKENHEENHEDTENRTPEKPLICPCGKEVDLTANSTIKSVMCNSEGTTCEIKGFCCLKCLEETNWPNYRKKSKRSKKNKGKE